jgi:uncharacterized protein (TIGR03435 family)
MISQPGGNRTLRRAAGIVLTLFACHTHGQTTNAKPQFEVASVKAAQLSDNVGFPVGMRGGPGTGDPTRLVIENFNLHLLVTEAYHLKGFQVFGLRMQDRQRFYITAKVPEGATKEDLQLMLQNLLAERFKMKVHHETKDLPIYELTIGKDGPRFKESAGEPPKNDLATPAPGAAELDKDGDPIAPPGTMRFSLVNGVARFRLNVAGESMEKLVTTLSNQLNQPVVDATGLKGQYDFVLFWSRQNLSPASPAPSPDGVAVSPEASGPTLIGAVQQQLGLKLESKKGPVEILVIDHYEKVPTEN